jgi:tetratricopeptide (TPR) repeat protein
MNLLFYLLIGVTAAGLTGGGVLLLRAHPPGRAAEQKRPGSRRQRASIVRQALHRLEQDERDPEALETLGDLFYQEGNFSSAYTCFQRLLPLLKSRGAADPLRVTLRLARSALMTGKPREAYARFLAARALAEGDFEANYNLGLLEYARRDYGKAAGFLAAALRVRPEHVAGNRYLGHSLLLLRRYPESIRALEKALDAEPENKRARFLLARAYLALNQAEPALELFSRLQEDRSLGALACLYSGTIHARRGDCRRAAEEFERGLRRGGSSEAVTLELRYRLAEMHRRQGDMARAVGLWRQIAAARPEYRDVRQKLAVCGQLRGSRGLQLFVMGPTDEFAALCQRAALRYFPSATLTSVNGNGGGFLDIQLHTHTPEREQPVLFRFVRSAEAVGEEALRQLYARGGELRVHRAVCACAGSFSEEARRFVAARKIELVDGRKLRNLLSG